MEKAIQKAIEGGYIESIHDGWKEWQGDYLLDPIFWQCLGKAEGWKKWKKDGGMELDEPVSRGQEPFLQPSWKWYWHSFIDHIADGGDIDTYFHKLLSNNLIK